MSFCRECEKEIEAGERIISYFPEGIREGQVIHLHVGDCVRQYAKKLVSGKARVILSMSRAMEEE